MRKIYTVVFALMVLLSVTMNAVASSSDTGRTIRFVQDMYPTLTASSLSDVNQQVTTTFIMTKNTDTDVS